MSVEDYWMGKGLDLDRLWADFDAGHAYIDKVSTSRLHLLRLTFGGHPLDLPLFDHEVIYKTVKGTFHEVKEECLSKAAYNAAAPIFLHRVHRRSGIFEFLAQFDPLMTWVVALGAASMWYRRAFAADQELDAKRLDFIRKHFPNATPGDTAAYLKAWTTFGRRRVLQRLLSQGVKKVELSPRPIDAKHPKPKKMVNMKRIVDVGDA